LYYDSSLHHLTREGAWTSALVHLTAPHADSWTKRTITFSSANYTGAYGILLGSYSGRQSSFWFDDVSCIEILQAGKRIVDTVETETGRAEAIPFALEGNYPNPFNPSTTIRYSIDAPTSVELVVYDIVGQKIAVLENQMKKAGRYSVVWNAGNLTSGAYFCRLITPKGILSRKLLLVK
jgi:hypothetical protein